MTRLSWQFKSQTHSTDINFSCDQSIDVCYSKSLYDFASAFQTAISTFIIKITWIDFLSLMEVSVQAILLLMRLRKLYFARFSGFGLNRITLLLHHQLPTSSGITEAFLLSWNLFNLWRSYSFQVKLLYFQNIPLHTLLLFDALTMLHSLLWSDWRLKTW